jgi:hypothetical protein
LDVSFAKTAYKTGDQVSRLQVTVNQKIGSVFNRRDETARSGGEERRWGDAYECCALQPDKGGEDVPEHRKQQDRFPPVLVRDYQTMIKIPSSQYLKVKTVGRDAGS